MKLISSRFAEARQFLDNPSHGSAAERRLLKDLWALEQEAWPPLDDIAAD
jgi:hypothetical protein